MTGRALTKASRGAVATGASATGAASLAAMAMGALALGAMAVGALAVGRLTVGRARLRRVEIGELAIGRLEVAAEGAVGEPTAVCRIRAAPGKGNLLERLVLDDVGSRPGILPYRAHRSRTDPDLFLLCEATRGAASGRRPQVLRIDALLRHAAELGLVATSGEDPAKVEIYQTI